MNVLNKDWIHVNRFILSASPKGSSQDRISKVDRIAGLEPVLVGYLPACVLDLIALPGVRVLRMLENYYCCIVKLLIRHCCLYAAR